MSRVSKIDPASGALTISDKAETSRPKASGFYEGATVGRLTQDWVTRNASLDTLMESGILRLRARSQQLVSNDGYALSALRQVLSNVLGESGFVLKVEARNKKNGRDKRASDEVQEAWREFCRASNYSVSRDMTEHEFDCLNLRSIFVTGSGISRMVAGFNNPFRFALQGIPTALLDPEYTLPARRITMSVEKNEWGEVVAYHLLQHNPGDRWRGGALHGPRRRIESDQIIHNFIREEFGQSQGVPWLAPVMARLRQLHGYEEAEVVAARAEASKIIFFETDVTAPGGGYKGEGVDETGAYTMDCSPGTGERLPPGVKPHLLDPNHPNGNYPDFRKGVLRGISAGLIANYNILAQDLEGVSYSSIRQGVLAERDMWKLVQRWYIETHKKPIFSEWLKWYLMSGQSKTLSMADYDRLNYPTFTGRRWEWVDPDKDSKAEERRLKTRLTSHQRIARARGEDFETILEEIREDEAAAGQMDLFLDLAPETPTIDAEIVQE